MNEEAIKTLLQMEIDNELIFMENDFSLAAIPYTRKN